MREEPCRLKVLIDLKVGSPPLLQTEGRKAPKQSDLCQSLNPETKGRENHQDQKQLLFILQEKGQN